jgi:hypothetical protein
MSERNERGANAWANARKPLPLLAPNTTNASNARTTRETCTHTTGAMRTYVASRYVMGAFGAFVVFGASIYAGLRAFAHAFASPGVRSLARARLLYSIFS